MRRAFTLIELLVVIATIALLLAILTSTLLSSRQYAKTAVCGSNVKHLVMALSIYEAETGSFPHAIDNTQDLPPPDGYPGYAQYDRKGWWWFNFIEGLYKKSAGRKTVLFCPSKHLGNPLLKDNILCGNYGVNQSVCKSSMGRRSCAEFVGKPVQLTEMPHPSQTVLVVDSGYSIINWWHAADRPPTTLGKQLIEDTAYVPGLSINKDRRFWSGQEEDAIGGRHPNKRVNIGYADGHLAIMKADELLVEKSGDSYKNRSPTWLPK